MSSHSFFILIFFYEISCTTGHKFVLNQQNCKMDKCKNKNNSNEKAKEISGAHIIYRPHKNKRKPKCNSIEMAILKQHTKPKSQIINQIQLTK